MARKGFCFSTFFSFLLLAGRAISRRSEQAPFHLQTTQIITENFSKYVQNVLDENNIKGLSLAVVKGNADAVGDIETGSWGVKTEDAVAVDSKTLFGIASCTKAFTATSLGILMEDFATGKNVTSLPAGVTEFNWQSKLVDLLPGEWELKDKWASEKVSVRDILSHVSGLAGQDVSYGPNGTERDLVLQLRHLDTALEPRQQPSYNNVMYMVAAHLVSVYSNRPFPEFVRERIFQPLGMHSTTMSPAEATRSGNLSHAWSSPLLNGSNHTIDGRRMPFWFAEETARLSSGAGGVISNAEDMAKWIDVQLHEGVIPSTNMTLIPKSVFDAVTTASVVWKGIGDEDSSIRGYGMGWNRQSSKGHEIISHSGGIPGFLSLVAFFPHDLLGFISLTNTDGGDIANEALLRRIVDDYFGVNVISERFDIISDSKGLLSPQSHPATNRRHHRATGSLDDYAGTYVHAGYGTITLCSSEDSLPSDDCAAVIRDFATVDNATGRARGPSLLAHWPRAVFSHLRMIPVNLDPGLELFEVRISTLFPEGYGKDKGPWEYTLGEGPIRFWRNASLSGVGGLGRVRGVTVCGIAGRPENFGDACEKFAAGQHVNEGWLVRFEKVEN